MDRKILCETLVDEFNDTPIDDNGLLEESFLTFGVGTKESDVWYWLEDRFHVALMEEFKNERTD